MWSFFIIGPALTAIATTLASMTGGMNFVVVAVAVSELQRRKNYKAGEGQFTERAGNTYYGVRFDKSSSYDLSQDLGRVAGAVPSLFESLIDLEFDMTKSEGQFLRAMLVPVMDMLPGFEEAKTMAVDEDGMFLLNEITEQLVAVIIPVRAWLAQFPRKRKKVS